MLATRLAMALAELDVPGPVPRSGGIGSGDVLVRTIRAAADGLSGRVSAKRGASDPRRPASDAAACGQAKAIDRLERAAAGIMHRIIGDLMRMTG